MEDPKEIAGAYSHCSNGFLGNRFGTDVECVNGVLIDIDEWHEGHDPRRIRPVAPCHPMWARQVEDPDGDWPNDSIERLALLTPTREDQSHD